MDAGATSEPARDSCVSREAALHQRRLLRSGSHSGNGPQSPSPQVSGADGVANADGAGREDVGAEAASVDHRAQQGGSGEALKMRARLAQPSADAADSSDLELLADKCVEINAARDDVAARVDRRELQAVVAEGVEDFALR